MQNNRNIAKSYPSVDISMNNTMPMECARTATTQKEEQRELPPVVIQREYYTPKDSAKIAIYQDTIKQRDLLRNHLNLEKKQLLMNSPKNE